MQLGARRWARAGGAQASPFCLARCGCRRSRCWGRRGRPQSPARRQRKVCHVGAWRRRVPLHAAVLMLCLPCSLLKSAPGSTLWPTQCWGGRGWQAPRPCRDATTALAGKRRRVWRGEATGRCHPPWAAAPQPGAQDTCRFAPFICSLGGGVEALFSHRQQVVGVQPLHKGRHLLHPRGDGACSGQAAARLAGRPRAAARLAGRPRPNRQSRCGAPTWRAAATDGLVDQVPGPAGRSRGRCAGAVSGCLLPTVPCSTPTNSRAPARQPAGCPTPAAHAPAPAPPAGRPAPT